MLVRQSINKWLARARVLMGGRRRLFATVLAVAFVVPLGVYAQGTFADGLATARQFNLPDAGVTTVAGLRDWVVYVIRILLSFVGLVAVVVIIYGGFLWMTARGNDKQVETAKQVVKNGVIGLVIMLSAYMIVSIIYGVLVGGSGGTGADGDSDGFTGCDDCFAVGGGFIEDHYPGINDEVSRDVDLYITFAEPVVVIKDGEDGDEDSFIAKAVWGNDVPTDSCPNDWWCGEAATDKFALEMTAREGGTIDEITDFVFLTRDKKLFYIDPAPLLGIETGDGPVLTDVKVSLSDIKLESGFEGIAGNNYSWNFSVNTTVDVQPPVVTEISPAEANLSPRNDSVIISFSEPINPVSATGVQNSGNGQVFNNLAVYADGVQVDGEFKLGNGYKDVWFTPLAECEEKNSCNLTMYCLPKDVAKLRVVVKTPTLASNAACIKPGSKDFEACMPAPTGNLLFDGVVDGAKNALDGSRNAQLPTGNGTAEGALGNVLTGNVDSLGDTFAWEFKTSSGVLVSPPIITGLTPSPDMAGVEIDTPFTASFNRTMLPATAYKHPNGKTYKPAAMYQQNTDAWVKYVGGFVVRQTRVKACSNDAAKTCTTNADCVSGGVCLNTCGTGARATCTVDADCTGATNMCGASVLSINHTGLENPDRAGGRARVNYEPRLGSTLQDRFQNCFYPPMAPAVTNSLYPNPAAIPAPADDVPVDNMTVLNP